MADNNYRAQADQQLVAPSLNTNKLTDIFYRAGYDPNAGESAKELAAAFGQAKPMLEKAGAAYNEEEVQKGAAAFATGVLEDGSKINKGEISKTQSFHFMRGYNVAEGKQQALEFSLGLEKKWRESDAYNSTDPEAFNTLMQTEMAAEMAKHQGANADWRAGWTASAPSVYNSLRAKQLARVDELYTEGAVSQLNTGITYALQNSQSPEQLKAALETNLQNLNNTGRLPFNKANEVLRERLLAHANDTKDTKWLDAMPDKLAQNNDTAGRVVAMRQHIQDFNRSEKNRQRMEDNLAFASASSRYEDALWRGDKAAATEARSFLVGKEYGVSTVSKLDRQFAQMREADAQRLENKRYQDPAWLESNATAVTSNRKYLDAMPYSPSIDKDATEFKGIVRDQFDKGQITGDQYRDYLMKIDHTKAVQPIFSDYFPLRDAQDSIRTAIPKKVGTLLNGQTYSPELDAERNRITKRLRDAVSAAAYRSMKADPSFLQDLTKQDAVFLPIIKQIKDEELAPHGTSTGPANVRGSKGNSPIDKEMNGGN